MGNLSLFPVQQKEKIRRRKEDQSSSLPALHHGGNTHSPNRNQQPTKDDILSYLDDDSLTQESIAMQLPRFEVGMTDKTIPLSEKKRREMQARKKQQIVQQHMADSPNGVKSVNDMIAMMEEVRA